MHALLADFIMIVHFAFVLFVVGGLALIWAGAGLGWRWVRNLWFRVAHLAAILFVAGEALVEDDLDRAAQELLDELVFLLLAAGVFELDLAELATQRGLRELRDTEDVIADAIRGPLWI